MKTFKKILIVAAVLVGAMVLISIVHHYQLKAAVSRYRAVLKANGEPLELAQVLPPSVPAERNGAELFLKAAVLVEQDKTFLSSNSIPGMKMVAPGKALFIAGQTAVRVPGEYGFTNSWEETQAALEQNKEALALLRQIINQPELDFHLRYDLGFNEGGFFTNAQLITLKRAALLLNSAAVCELHRGDTGLAVENVRASLTLANAMQSQRMVISELVRIAIAAITQARTWEILQATNVTDAQLSTLQADWARLDFLQGHKDALNMERVLGDVEVARWRSSNREMEKLAGLYYNAYSVMYGDDGDKPRLFQRVKLTGEFFLWRYWWSYSDELRSLKGHAALMETARLAGTTGAFLPAFKQQNARLDELGISKLKDSISSVFSGDLDFYSMLSESILTLGNFSKKVMTAEYSQRMTVTAIALKRFQLKHGSLPEKLSGLTPEFLAAVPRDPVDGQPLRYRRNPDGTFLLYSIGEDGVDDGGDPRPPGDSKSVQWQNGRDWVWPQPATSVEIASFFAHPPK